MNCYPTAHDDWRTLSETLAVAELVVEFYDWIHDNGGMSPDEILEVPLNEKQRALLCQSMDDILVIYHLAKKVTAAPERS